MPAINQLIERDQTEPRRILILGDGMTDVYVHGKLEETCQEGCPKFIEEEVYKFPGGAANAGRSLLHWKVKTLFLIGTGVIKTRYMVEDRCVFRHDDDDTQGRRFEAARQNAITTLETWHPHAVLISDYDKGFLTPELIREVIRTCTYMRIPCVADAKREPQLYEGAILKCNSDYQHRYNRELSMSVYDVYGTSEKLVVTAGPLTPVAWDSGKLKGKVPFLPPVQCRNHVGAGDAFAAYLTLGLAYGLPLPDAVAVAHSAGRVYVQYPHNRPPMPDEIRADMLSGPR